jgi:hypothetical protein
MALKPFLPQLQRTFARGLADTTSETLRNRAAKGLGILITLTPRVDPLIAGELLCFPTMFIWLKLKTVLQSLLPGRRRQMKG